MVEVAVANGDKVFNTHEEENLSDTERFEIDDFTLISSELAQEVEDGPAEKPDSGESSLPPLPTKKDKKKNKHKQKKTPEPEPVDIVPKDDSNSHTEAVVEVPEKHKKSERRRLKRIRVESEDEEDAEESDTKKKKKEKKVSVDEKEEEDVDDVNEKLERRRRRTEKKSKTEDAEHSTSIRKEKTKEKNKDKEKNNDKEKSKDKSRNKEDDKGRDKEREPKEENNEYAEEVSDSEPEDTEVVPVSTFLSEYRPTLAIVDDVNTTKRRSKFGESILSRRPASPKPFERPRIRPSVPPTTVQPPPPPPPLQLPSLPSEPTSNSYSQWDTYPQSAVDPLGFPHQQWDRMLMEQQQQQQLQQQQEQQMHQHYLQQQQSTGSHIHNPPSQTQLAKKHHTELHHNKDNHKKHRDKDKREKEKEKKKKKMNKDKSTKAQLPKLDPSTPEYSAKRKEFKLKLSETIGVRLKKYFRANRIANKEDFKHLARKFTHKIMTKEDAKAVFAITNNTEEKLHKVIDAYFERHNTYSRNTNNSNGNGNIEPPDDL